MIRAFLAIRPSEEVLRNLEDVQKELASGGADARWIGADAMHLTVQFLGDVRESELPAIEQGLGERLREIKPFDTEFRGLGVFPNQKRPRVIWVGLVGAGLSAVADAVETVLSPLGFPPQEREFSPHVTLGRVRSVHGVEGMVRTVKASGERTFGVSRVDRITLYRSVLRPDGAVYTPLREFPLGGDS
jgi:RNA 2',3'-cyclic 3'-phosphodiesterase